MDGRVENHERASKSYLVGSGDSLEFLPELLRLRGASPPAGGAFVVAKFGGEILCLAPSSVTILQRHFPATVKNLSRMPEGLRRWLHSQLLCQENGSGAKPLVQPFIKETGEFRLSVQMQLKTHGTIRLVLNEQRVSSSSNSGPVPSLTNREAEVLHWIAETKSNPEIAMILGISPRTVHKHVEHILRKLGVETRWAAAKYQDSSKRPL